MRKNSKYVSTESLPYNIETTYSKQSISSGGESKKIKFFNFFSFFKKNKRGKSYSCKVATNPLSNSLNQSTSSLDCISSNKPVAPLRKKRLKDKQEEIVTRHNNFDQRYAVKQSEAQITPNTNRKKFQFKESNKFLLKKLSNNTEKLECNVDLNISNEMSLENVQKFENSDLCEKNLVSLDDDQAYFSLPSKNSDESTSKVFRKAVNNVEGISLGFVDSSSDSLDTDQVLHATVISELNFPEPPSDPPPLNEYVEPSTSYSFHKMRKNQACQTIPCNTILINDLTTNNSRKPQYSRKFDKPIQNNLAVLNKNRGLITEKSNSLKNLTSNTFNRESDIYSNNSILIENDLKDMHSNNIKNFKIKSQSYNFETGDILLPLPKKKSDSSTNEYLNADLYNDVSESIVYKTEYSSKSSSSGSLVDHLELENKRSYILNAGKPKFTSDQNELNATEPSSNLPDSLNSIIMEKFLECLPVSSPPIRNYDEIIDNLFADIDIIDLDAVADELDNQNKKRLSADELLKLSNESDSLYNVDNKVINSMPRIVDGHNHNLLISDNVSEIFNANPFYNLAINGSNVKGDCSIQSSFEANLISKKSSNSDSASSSPSFNSYLCGHLNVPYEENYGAVSYAHEISNFAPMINRMTPISRILINEDNVKSCDSIIDSFNDIVFKNIKDEPIINDENIPSIFIEPFNSNELENLNNVVNAKEPHVAGKVIADLKNRKAGKFIFNNTKPEENYPRKINAPKNQQPHPSPQKCYSPQIKGQHKYSCSIEIPVASNSSNKYMLTHSYKIDENSDPDNESSNIISSNLNSNADRTFDDSTTSKFVLNKKVAKSFNNYNYKSALINNESVSLNMMQKLPHNDKDTIISDDLHLSVQSLHSCTIEIKQPVLLKTTK